MSGITERDELHKENVPRLRVLPLPGMTVGDFSDAPFLLIVDNAEGTYLEDDLSTADFDAIKETIGARGVLVFSGAIDLDGAEVRDRTEELTALADGQVV